MNRKRFKTGRGIGTDWFDGISRRGVLKGVAVGALCSILHPFHRIAGLAAATVNPLFHVKDIPDDPFYEGGNYHEGVDALLHLMGIHDLKFYRSSNETALSGPLGLIEPDDVVLIKVNAQWKYRGCTNSDLIRGLIQRIIEHPDGFTGEVVIFENGQSQGSLNGDALGWGSYPDHSVHANANDESHSFNYLVNTVFDNPRVSSYLLDPIRGNFIGDTDHSSNGYRRYEDVSYPCFTTAGGHRVELLEGIWQGTGYSQNLKLINVPVLKIHDGSEITASLKHFYGVLSMSDGSGTNRHYSGLGNTCGKMVVSVRRPVLNLLDAIWVSSGSLSGYPASATYRANQILASQDPIALDYCAAKYILYPITQNSRHLPTYSGIDAWLTSARDMINNRGGLYDPALGIFVHQVTKNEGEVVVWVTTSDAGDTMGPSLSITSHANGQPMTTSSITLAGTASDSGKGDNGIQQVTVNGVRANNDTAIGNGTANWDKIVTLNPGINTITVIAYDDSPNQNPTSRTITIYYYLGTIYVSKNELCNVHSPCSSNIQDGIDMASVPSIIKITEGTYDENVTLDFDKVILLSGGWGTDFISNSSHTTINGSLTVTNGTMTLDHIILN
jgi:hypothetical protein